MNYFLVWYKVADYAAWKQMFDATKAAQEAAGFRLVHLWRAREDKSRVIVLFSLEDVARAEAFLQSPEVGQAMRQAGVLEAGGEFLTEE